VRPRIAIALALILALATASTALGTVLGSVRYTPPKITLVDLPETGSQEDVLVTKQGAEYSFAQPAGLGPHADSEPGCSKNTTNDFRCPVAGIKKIVLNLGQMDDGAGIGLGSKARKVTQILRGGSGEDTLTGGPGAQQAYGGADDDTIILNAGRDFIDGGDGTDTCFGGPGRDTIRNCE
jgi:hypothetical protein